MTEKEILICGHGSGTPRVANMYSYLQSRYETKASNGVRKGLVSVRRLKALTDEGRQRCHDNYRTILARNLYNQDLRAYVYEPYKTGKYYSDCSSSQMATMQKAGFVTGGLLNTAGIFLSELFEEVPVVIEAGHIQNPEILKPFVQLLFSGNDPSRPKQIGHVEGIYEIPGYWEPETFPRWEYSGGKWYYRLAKDENAHGWQLINHHWYYFHLVSGAMLKDWQLINDKWYYLHPTAGAQYEGALYRSDDQGAQDIWYVN